MLHCYPWVNRESYYSSPNGDDVYNVWSSTFTSLCTYWRSTFSEGRTHLEDKPDLHMNNKHIMHHLLKII
jgi:hypothetical protein